MRNKMTRERRVLREEAKTPRRDSRRYDDSSGMEVIDSAHACIMAKFWLAFANDALIASLHGLTETALLKTVAW